MSKKKTRKNTKKKFKAKEKRLAAVVVMLYAFSLVMDGLLTAFVLWPMEEGNAFVGAYGCYTTLGSGVVGLTTVFFACLTTKKSETVRELVTPCIVTRGAVLLVLDIVLMIINPTWTLWGGERSVVVGVYITFLGGLFFGIQVLLCRWIASALYYPYPSTPYSPLTPDTPSDEPTESHSNGDIIVTSSVKNTDYYKSKCDEEYRKLMGFPPKEESKPDYSDLDSHDYSHIFEDNNY